MADQQPQSTVSQVAAPQPAAIGTPTQQPAQIPQPSNNVGASDQLVCQWQNCGERCPTAEQLYVSLAMHTAQHT